MKPFFESCSEREPNSHPKSENRNKFSPGSFETMENCCRGMSRLQKNFRHELP